MRLKHFVLALAAFAALALLPTTTRADNLVFTFTPATYTGAAGSVVTLLGTFQNGTGAITFTGYDATLQTGLSLSPNGDPGSQPFDALVGMTSGQTLGPIALFNVLIAPGTPDGTVFTFAGNFFEIFYDGTQQSDSASSNFQIVVRNQGQVIPEPATMFLLGTGLVSSALAMRRKRRQGLKG
jgi:hypothetical protein